MEISEFAERILYGQRFEDKLISPEALTDGQRGDGRRVPRLPGRPEELRLDRKRARVPFPGTHDLDKPGVRGKVLHFFANHELLATELMALCLLRFPDAPDSFRRGLVETIFEEQRHLRMYEQRMNEAGVALGEIPVNAFFWDALSGMEDPIDFVTGMSLTFEQANLDYSKFYAEAFRRAGDDDTADVLDIVYREEIGHVKHGVVWFNRWRDDSVDEFDAYERHLRHPLNPSRARGKIFDLDGRRQAGLSDDYIQKVEVFGGSKGRPPVLWFGNFSAEHRWIHGEGHPLPNAVAALERDLEALPLLLCAEDDLIIVRHRPSADILAPLARTGFARPGFVEVGPDLATPEPGQKHLSEFSPWAWSPDMSRWLEPLGDRLVRSGLPLTERVAVASRMNRKALSASWLGEFLQENTDPRLSAVSTVGTCARTVQEALQAARARLAHHEPVVCKADQGSSGRNAIRAFSTEDLPLIERWLSNTLHHHECVVIEPWLRRRADFSIVGRVDESGRLVVHGITRFLTDERGQWLGSVLGRPNDGLDSDIIRFRHGEGKEPRFMANALERAASFVGARLHTAGYIGYFGVDALVHETTRGQLQLRPIVEVNARLTMGHVAQAIGKRLAGGTAALWRLIRKTDVREPAGFAARMRTMAPPKWRGNAPDQQLESGVVFTSDPNTAEQVFSLVVVGTSLAKCEALLHSAGVQARSSSNQLYKSSPNGESRRAQRST